MGPVFFVCFQIGRFFYSTIYSHGVDAGRFMMDSHTLPDDLFYSHGVDAGRFMMDSHTLPDYLFYGH